MRPKQTGRFAARGADDRCDRPGRRRAASGPPPAAAYFLRGRMWGCMLPPRAAYSHSDTCVAPRGFGHTPAVRAPQATGLDLHQAGSGL